MNNIPYSRSIQHYKTHYKSTTLDIFANHNTDINNKNNKVILYFPGQFNDPLHEMMANFLTKYKPQDTVIVTIKHPSLFTKAIFPSLSSWVKSGEDALEAVNNGITLNNGKSDVKTLQVGNLENLHIICYSLGGLVGSNALSRYVTNNTADYKNKKRKFGSINIVSPACRLSAMRGIPLFCESLAIHHGFHFNTEDAFKKMHLHLDPSTKINIQHGLNDIYVPHTQTIDHLFEPLQKLNFNTTLELVDNCSHEEMILKDEILSFAFTHSTLSKQITTAI